MQIVLLPQRNPPGTGCAILCPRALYRSASNLFTLYYFGAYMQASPGLKWDEFDRWISLELRAANKNARPSEQVWQRIVHQVANSPRAGSHTRARGGILRYAQNDGGAQNDRDAQNAGHI